MRTIAHISDLHFGRHDPRIVEALLESLDREKPDLVAVSGDLTQRARTAQFQEARRVLDLIRRPLLVVPGNHDIPLYNVVRRFTAPLARYDRYVAPASLPGNRFADPEMSVLGLNTARRSRWKEGRVSLAQIADIQSVFAPLPSSVWKIVVSHHPIALLETAASGDVAERAALALDAMRIANVRILLSGHHHHAVSGEGAFDVVQKHALLVIHAGTAVSTRTRGHNGNSYNVLQLEEDRVTVRVMQARQTRFEAVASLSYALKEDRWLAIKDQG